MRYSEEQIEHYLSFLKPDKQQDREDCDRRVKCRNCGCGRRWVEPGVRNVV